MDVKKAAVVGAGTMGGEIAYVISAAGIPVILKDIDQTALDAGMEKARQIYAFKVKRRRMTQEEMDERIRLIEPTLEFEPFADASIVIEAVPEILEIKMEAMNALDYICPPEAIFASNTSALSIEKIGSRTRREDRVVGMHFFNPVSMLRLVEVVRSPKTSAETVKAACEFAEQIGKLPAPMNECAGFVVNRLLCAAFLEAIRLREEGAAQETVDRCLVSRDAGLPVGLFKMADQLGVDLLHKVMAVLNEAYGERFAVPEAIRALYEAKKFGVKAGAGFYDYSSEAPPAPAAPAAPAGEADEAQKAEIVERVLGAVYREALRIEAEGVADREVIDLSMKNGALFKNPPFAFADGLDDAARARIKARFG